MFARTLTAPGTERKFFLRSDKLDALKVRIHFLAYEADVDLLEIATFAATVNLAALCIERSTSGLPTHTFDFVFRFLHPFLWSLLLSALAAGQLLASLFNHVFIRCWLQFMVSVTFLLYVVLVFARAAWLLAPRDYLIFGALAAIAHLRLRSAARQIRKG